MTTGRKLAIAGIVVAGVTAYMAYVGAAASWQYYATTDECLATPAQFAGHGVRVSGKIVPGSLRITADRREASFQLVGAKGNLPVVCTGPLPENLAERMEVVAEGRLEDPPLLRGEKVLTRCASKYKSQAAASEDQGNWKVQNKGTQRVPGSMFSANDLPQIPSPQAEKWTSPQPPVPDKGSS